MYFTHTLKAKFISPLDIFESSFNRYFDLSPYNVLKYLLLKLGRTLLYMYYNNNEI